MRPAIPGLQFVPRTQSVEKDKILQPPRIFLAEIFQSSQHIIGGSMQEIARRLEQQRHLLRENVVVFYRAGSGRQPVEFYRVESCRVKLCQLNPAALRQALQADQQRIPGKSRGRGIRRVAVADRPERQNLPQALASRSKKIDEAVGSRAEIADAAA